MRSSKRAEGSVRSSTQLPAGHGTGTELNTAWKTLAQSKAALRHIENQLEAVPGSGVLLESLMEPKKRSSKRVVSRDGQQLDDPGGASKRRGQSHQSPEKSSSRSPLRNTTQESNVCRSATVEFREPLASFRDASPPPPPSSHPDTYSLISAPGCLYSSSPPVSDSVLSQLVYQRDTRDKQTDKDLDSTHSSALRSTEVCYLNDLSALSAMRAAARPGQPKGVKASRREETGTGPGAVAASSKAHIPRSMESDDSNPCLNGGPDPLRQIESSSSSPGSAPQRLENLRRHQPDNKLEKLKERIRKQRQHLEEAAQRDKLLGYLERPIVPGRGGDNGTMPTAKLRKVAAAPPAPVYKGFSSTETKIQTPDGRVWTEDEFPNLSREMYRELSQQFAETTRLKRKQQKAAEGPKERRPSKPVRKVYKATPAPGVNSKPMISPASWRDGQKVVKMMLGRVSKLPREDELQSADRPTQAEPPQCSTSSPRSERRSRPSSANRGRGRKWAQSNDHSQAVNPPSPTPQEKAPEASNAELLSADIQEILDDLHLERRPAETEGRARSSSRAETRGRRGGSGSRSRAPVSTWGSNTITLGPQRGCRSTSPTVRQTESADAAQKKRHYDADTVRQYMSRKQEDRKRQQAEEKKAQREEAERKSQRLQELYKKQRGVAKAVALPTAAAAAPVTSAQRRLQETYNQLLEEATHTQQNALPPQLQRQMYQPSGESDKENKRLEPPQSPSSSDRSLTDQLPPPLSRNDLDVPGLSAFPVGQPDAAPSSVPAPSGDHLLSQFLRLETAMAAREQQPVELPPPAPLSGRSRTKHPRIEALKAKAASLSNRIEREARKLAGEGISYGAVSATDSASVPIPLHFADGHQVGASSPLLQDTAALVSMDNDVALRIQRILSSAGQSSYNNATPPALGNQSTLMGQKEKRGPPYDLTAHPQPMKMVNGPETISTTGKTGGQEVREEKRTERHESSGDSISEGPLSEGSISDEDAGTSALRSARPAQHLQKVERGGGHRISEFQREAAKYSSFGCPFVQQESPKAPWEDLNKGSPLSVINIFTRNLQGQLKVGEEKLERHSPSAHSLPAGVSSREAGEYEDDFASSPISATSGHTKHGYNSHSHSMNSHYEELIRRSPHEQNMSPHHSSLHSSLHSPHHSSGSPSTSSPLSKSLSRKRGEASDHSDGAAAEEQRSSNSPSSEALSSESRKTGSKRNSARARSSRSESALGGASGISHQSFGDKKKSAVTRTRLASPSGACPAAAGSPNEPVRNGTAAGPSRTNTNPTARNGRPTTKSTELQYSPAALHQRMAAELHYLASLEESIRQLSDVEKLRAVSLAQQESVSLAQMIKSQQQRHEQELYELKIKAEREALEAQLQLEESRQRVAKAHIELQESAVVNQKETLGGLQEATTKMMSQQAEAARYTADAARHIKEMTELARSQIAGALIVPPVAAAAAVPSMLGQLEEQHSPALKQPQSNDNTDSSRSEVSGRRTRPEEPLSSLNSLSHSHSQSYTRSNYSGANGIGQYNQSYASLDSKAWKKKEAGDAKRKNEGVEERDAVSSSIEEEIPTAASESLCSDSVPSALDDKGETTSVATEYSMKFDESMTEDEIEERSFRSLLPSEAHRRGTLEKKSHQHDQLDEAHANAASNVGMANSFKSQDSNIAFSCGQDSFSQFTMDMVRQYMKDEEVRLQHQSALLHLRQKALKEKTKTELAWLEHQKKRLRDKGEDDKMPPIRKKQRGLLMKLQQEQAEIKRLQEANKAARKERLLLLKQQEEIERMRSSTLRLKERLKCAGGEELPEAHASQTPASEAASPPGTGRPVEDTRSPSPPLSVSGSETSSIMQKLKKMRSQMDEKFLTKREQQLVHRRHHAEELLQWKKRLDQEEAEVRRMEKEAMAALDRQTSQERDGNASDSQEKGASDISSASSHQQSFEHKSPGDKESAQEGTPDSSIHTEKLPSQEPESPSSARPATARDTTPTPVWSGPPDYTQDFSSASPSQSRHSPVAVGNLSSAASKTGGSKMPQIHPQGHVQPADTHLTTDPISDQSDIEVRIRALKEELRKRKVMAYQLKKEQKKRQKERLKAQEANLLKQLESYNHLIEKTKAELNKEPEATVVSASSVKDDTSAAKLSSVEPPCPHGSGHNNVTISPQPERIQTDAPSVHNGHSKLTSQLEGLSEEDTPTVTLTPVRGSLERLSSQQSTEVPPRPPSKEDQSTLTKPDETIVSDILEELGEEASYKSEERSECILKLVPEDKRGIEQKVTDPDHDSEPAADLQHNQQKEAQTSANVGTDVKPPEQDDVSHTTDSATASSKRERVPSSHTADYQDDFESSVDSSPRGDAQNSKPQLSASPAETRSSRKSSSSSQDGEIEEDIDGDLSQNSGQSVDGHQSGCLLDLNKETRFPQHDVKDVSNSIQSPPHSPAKATTSPPLDEMSSFNVGDRVLVGGVQPGTLRFKGATRFAEGFWAGVELDKAEGSNNGTYDGVTYFKCEECHGIFAPPDKIAHLPIKFELDIDVTEDEDSFFDDSPDKSEERHQTEEADGETQRTLKSRSEQSSHADAGSGDKAVTDDNDQSDQHQKSQTPLKTAFHLDQVTNGDGTDIILDLEDISSIPFISKADLGGIGKEDMFENQKDKQLQHQHFTPKDVSAEIGHEEQHRQDEDLEDTLADKLLASFVEDAMKQFAEIRRVKEQKISAANQLNAEILEQSSEDRILVSSVEQKDGLPFFPIMEKDELSSPELCNRPESPVLGASGQEELAKRLAELELSRELLGDEGDEQDWFDEDFGLSSRREQQRLKQRQREEEEEARLAGLRSVPGAALGGLVPSPGGEHQVKTPPRPELPLPLPPKLPEQPAMVVPHLAEEVEKMVYAATQEIWTSCGLGTSEEPLGLSQVPKPSPSQEYLGEEPNSQDLEALSIRSYRKAVYDLTWEIFQEIYAEDPNIHQPPWVKPRRRVKSACFHRVKLPGNVTVIQEFITAEVLKLYGLSKDHNQKPDWQKMLKFGRKKRDRVDHILVQELHEEEALWVNYDEDELFVKQQLADSVFEALLKDTANALALIFDDRDKRAVLS